MKRLGRIRKKDERGVALIMVLGAITVLTVFLTELQQSTTAELSAALAERDGLKAEYVARSAVNLSRLLIATERSIRNSLAMSPIGLMFGGKPPQIPVWEFTDLVLGPYNDTSGVAAFGGLIQADPSTGKNLGLGGGSRFELKIVDEDSKMNLNVAAKSDPISIQRVGGQLVTLMGGQQYNPLFEQHDADDQFSDRATICGAIVDWADADELLYGCDPTSQRATSTGAEDNFYQVIGLPYRRKNAAFDSLDELRLVRGVGDDFWATFVDPEPNDPHKRPVTVWGQDKINVNSANAMTLWTVTCNYAVPETELCNDPVQVAGFLTTVSMFKSMLPIPIFRSPADFIKTMKGQGMLPLSAAGISPVTFKSEAEVKKALTIESNIFSIYAEGIVPGNRRETRMKIHAVVDRRSAQELGEAMLGLPGGQNANTAGGASGQTGRTGANNQAAADASPDAIKTQLTSNPAGNIIYWRVE